VHDSAHAAFYGSGWDGQLIACIVTGVADPAPPAAAASGSGSHGGGDGEAAEAAAASLQPARLQFHFRSESSEVIAHVQVGQAGWLAGNAGTHAKLQQCKAPGCMFA
jgi:hypothetical protein